jgi:hypothetical protein
MSQPTPPTLAGAIATMDDANKGVPWGKLTLWQYMTLFLRGLYAQVLLQVTNSGTGNTSLAAIEAAVTLQTPATNAVAVTPHDTNALAATSRALFVGTGGTTLTVRLSGAGADVVFTNVPDGTLLPIRVTHVRATGTDADDIVSLS